MKIVIIILLTASIMMLLRALSHYLYTKLWIEKIVYKLTLNRSLKHNTYLTEMEL